MIDLHSHTTASDGQHTPEELVAIAARAGVTTLGVTDHDTVSGLAACEAAATAKGLRIVRGIEVSAFINNREVHILGHFIDPAEPNLAGFSSKLKIERESRMEEMVNKLKGLGFPVTMQQVRDLAGDVHLARPHLARVLVELGYCTSTKEVFSRFLKDGGPAWVQRFEVSTSDAIALIHKAHGTATLAHPGTSKVERHEVAQLRAEGLDGLEVEHSDHPPSQREKYHAWAAETGLVPTAGTDFHGDKVAPDRVFGKVTMTAERLATLEARRA